ncbi:hypothetical protein MLD38_016391 [Melastoma candidum]|uniref:Uncharacterized protein n=1 Tax=Melastoma candidum TaxID=119954 RepID=A0ACB9RMZ4_9MYRT|nr:hypothetical protein MLD38_016391 [Melastoma candidum]
MRCHLGNLNCSTRHEAAAIFLRVPVKFKILTADNLVPVRLDIEIDGQRYRDGFTWNPADPDSEVVRSQLADFCSYEGQAMYAGEKLVPKRELEIEDPEVGPAIAYAIREQLYEIANQSLTSAREIRLSKKGHWAFEYTSASKAPGISLDLVKYFGPKNSVVQKRKDWDMFNPIADILSSEEVVALQAREERNAR